MSEANKELLRRFYEEIFNQGRLDAVDELLAPDCVEHTPPPGFATDQVHAALKQFTEMLRAGFPDVRFTADEMISEGDFVGAFWTAEGTHEGDLFGVPASGRRVAFEGLDLIRFADGKATDHWGFDNLMLRLTEGGAPPA
jgi:steroid delta-isomerase-like uncharacterized protein